MEIDDISEKNEDISVGVEDWKSLVQMVSDLPPLSNIAIQASKLLEDPKTTPDRVAELVSRDTGLAARVLKIANSAMFARQGRIETLNRAVVLIGFRTLRGLVLAAAMREVMSDNSLLDKMIWQNSICTASISGEIAKVIKPSYQEEVVTYGLIHDMGKMAILNKMRMKYAKVMDTVCQGCTFADAEQIRIGYTHALVGALVAKKWNFPMEMCKAILHHHDLIEQPLDSPELTKTAIVQSADQITYIIGVGRPDGYPDRSEVAVLQLKSLGIPNPEKFIDTCQKFCE